MFAAAIQPWPPDKQRSLTLTADMGGRDLNTSWAYEQEWRIIDPENGPGYRAYPPELLKSVIFGLRMSGPDRELVKKWVGQRGHSRHLGSNLYS